MTPHIIRGTKERTLKWELNIVNACDFTSQGCNKQFVHTLTHPPARLARACKFGSFSDALIHVFLIGQVMEDVDGVKFLIFSKNPEGTRF